MAWVGPKLLLMCILIDTLSPLKKHDQMIVLFALSMDDGVICIWDMGSRASAISLSITM
jgi:hypothetical protein